MDRLTGKALRLAPARTETHATYIFEAGVGHAQAG